MVQIQPGSCNFIRGGGATGRRTRLRPWLMRVRLPSSVPMCSADVVEQADTHARGACGAFRDSLRVRLPPSALRRARVAQTADARSSNLRPLRVRISPLASIPTGPAGVVQLADTVSLNLTRWRFDSARRHPRHTKLLRPVRPAVRTLALQAGDESSNLSRAVKKNFGAFV